MKRRSKDIEADVVRLIITTREKFPHSVAWTAALKRVIWRYTHVPAAGPTSKKRKTRRTAA